MLAALARLTALADADAAGLFERVRKERAGVVAGVEEVVAEEGPGELARSLPFVLLVEGRVEAEVARAALGLSAGAPAGVATPSTLGHSGRSIPNWP